MSAERALRPALPPDAAAVADVYLRSFDAAMPTVRRAHSDDEVRDWIRHVLIPAGYAWVAEVDDQVVGLIVVRDGWIEQLYVDPAWQRRGTGAQLLTLAKEHQPSGLQLWTFQVNRPAQQFYERQGFSAVERTDGSANEEREPDLRYVWPGKTYVSGPNNR